MEWYYDPASYTVAIFGALFGFITGNLFLPTALLFSFFCFTGTWAMYRTFVNIYPKLHKELALAFLFIPSTFVWGSGIYKDTICMFALGWMTYTLFRIFIHKNISAKNILLLIFSFYLIALVKIYILLAFIPALGLWLLLTYSGKIKSAGLKWIVGIFFGFITISGFFYFSQKFAQELNRYSLERIVETANTTRGWITHVSEDQGGSAYDLGDFEPTLQGMLSKFPAAVAVTLYRPFLWEVGKPIMLLSALEALAFLLFTIAVFYKLGFKLFKFTLRDPTLLFFFIFSIIFAFAVGISTYNFGSLSRYKIPCMPFFAAWIMILYDYSKSKKIIQIKRVQKPVHHFA